VCYSYGCSTLEGEGTTHFSGFVACGHTKGDAIGTFLHPFIIMLSLPQKMLIIEGGVRFLRPMIKNVFPGVV